MPEGIDFSHLLYLGSRKALTKIFGIKRLPLASTTLTRLFNKIEKMISVERLSEGLWGFLEGLIPWGTIREDWLSFDSTVIERYGKQEGAKKEYNPRKRGIANHNPLIAFLNRSKYVVHLWNQRGDVISYNNIHDFFKTTMERISDKIKIIGVIADSGFYERLFIEMLEKANKIYIIAARLYHTLQREIYALKDWVEVTEGIRIGEFYFKHEGWEKERRYIVVRQERKIRKEATGKQLRLFEEELREYSYSVWITNSKEDAYTVWCECRDRGNDENTIKELKEDFVLARISHKLSTAEPYLLTTAALRSFRVPDVLLKYAYGPFSRMPCICRYLRLFATTFCEKCGLGGFSMKKFYATEAAMLIRIFAYNLFVLFRTLVMEQKEKIERLKTLRYKYFVLPAQFKSSDRKFILQISAQTKGIKEQIQTFIS